LASMHDAAFAQVPHTKFSVPLPALVMVAVRTSKVYRYSHDHKARLKFKIYSFC